MTAPVFTDRWRLHRADWVATQVLLVVVAGLCLATYLAPPLVAWLGGGPLEVAAATSQTAAVPGLQPTGARVEFAGQVRWIIAEPAVWQWLLILLPVVLTTGLVLAGVLLLWRLVRLARSGEPFGLAALRSIRMLAVLVLAYAVVLPFVRVAVGFAVLAPVQAAPGIELTVLPWQATPFVVGMLLLVLGEVFRIGLRLRHDVDGLV